MAESAAYAGILQEIDSPEGCGQCADAYAKRFASAAGCSAIHPPLAFGLDSTLHQTHDLFDRTAHDSGPEQPIRYAKQY